MGESKNYAVQINAKVGDHLINIQGDSVAEAMERLHQLAENSVSLHGALTILDGRPATEVVQKEKQWGGRSQYGRSYPKTNTVPTHTPANVAATTPGASPEQLLRDQLGATTVTTETRSTSEQPINSPNGTLDVCPTHGLKRVYKPGGENERGKFSASYRCPAQGCRPVWQKRDGSWG
jgi:hypothetical protein